MQHGTVYLVGAGPGDPKLITVRGLELLRSADVVLYDRLINGELLKECRAGAELIYCGKSPGRHTLSQEEINKLLVRKAAEGKQVVRLKGGDPTLFGRGGEEAEACALQGIRYEIVPGITAGIAAPAYAGIPVTHRAVSSSVTFVTGHKQSGPLSGELDWQALSRMETIVFYMGLGNLSEICRRLTDCGKSPETPVAIVRCATRPSQETVVTDLGRAERDAEEAGIVSPAVIVVGEVVRAQLALETDRHRARLRRRQWSRRIGKCGFMQFEFIHS